MKSSADIIAWRSELARCIGHGYTCFKNHYLLQGVVVDQNTGQQVHSNAAYETACSDYVRNKRQSLRMR